MKKIASSLAIPLVLLAVSLVSFGGLSPQLGFYLDDWVNLAAYRLDGLPGLWGFYLADNRPASAWMYVILFPLLGVKALNWHILTLVLRWLTAVVFWRFLRALWPQNISRAAWISLLFSIYPAFFQQPSAVTYTQQWVCYLLFSFSLYTMTAAVRNPHQYWIFTLLGAAASAANLVTMEYFAGMELLRPIFLWQVFSNEQGYRKRLGAVLNNWLPYLFVVFLFILWRLIYVPTLIKDRNEPYLLVDLFRQPLQTSIRLLEMGLQDLVNILITAWHRTIEPEVISFRTPSALISWALATAMAAAVYFLSRIWEPAAVHPSSQKDPSDIGWSRQALLVGFLGVLVGALPGWMIGRWSADPSGIYNDRFALASMFGASIFIAAGLDIFISRLNYRIIILCILIGTAAGAHYRSENNYRWSWTNQQRFYWQIYWRAPAIQPGTAVISERELFPYMGRWPTAFAINLLYPQDLTAGQAGYWFFLAEKDIGNLFSEFSKGIDLVARYRSFTFKGNSRNVLVIHYDQQKSYCLWVLDPHEGNNPELTDRIAEIQSFSNLETISDEPQAGFPPVELFGNELEHNWCYYFQKADLARQLKSWDRIPDLWSEANRKGLKPNSGVELVPFIESFAHLGGWEQAVDLTRSALSVPTIKDMTDYYCAVWKRIETETAVSRESPASLVEVRNLLRCR